MDEKKYNTPDQETAPQFDWVPFANLDTVTRQALQHDYQQRGIPLPPFLLVQSRRTKSSFSLSHPTASSLWHPSGNIDLDFQEALRCPLEVQIERLPQIISHYQENMRKFSNQIQTFSAIISQYEAEKRSGKLLDPPKGWEYPLAIVDSIHGHQRTTERKQYIIYYHPLLQYFAVYTFLQQTSDRTSGARRKHLVLDFSITQLEDLKQKKQHMEDTIQNIQYILDIVESLPRIRIQRLLQQAVQLTKDLHWHLCQKQKLEQEDPYNFTLIISRSPNEPLETFLRRLHEHIIRNKQQRIDQEEQAIGAIQQRLRQITHDLEQAGNDLTSSSNSRSKDSL